MSYKASLMTIQIVDIMKKIRCLCDLKYIYFIRRPNNMPYRII